MAPEHRFGGSWTDEKLERVRQYLCAYTTIFRANDRARYFRTTYVDAFAGTGHRIASAVLAPEQQLMLDESADVEATAFKKGSAAIALEVQPAFDQYVFMEEDPQKVRELQALRARYPDRAERVRIAQEEANGALMRFAVDTDWSSNRAVVFLDPYGMSVEWTTIEALGHSKGVDLWILFPLGQAVNRLLMKKGVPPTGWAEALTRCFGTDEWRSEFYKSSAQLSLLDESPSVEKIATLDSIASFFKRRLATCFAGVAENSLRLCNSRNSPLFLLCFAAANARGAKTAIRIANYILADG